MNKLLRTTIWHINPMMIPKTKYGLKVHDLRKKAIFLKCIRQQCITKDLKNKCCKK